MFQTTKQLWFMDVYSRYNELVKTGFINQRRSLGDTHPVPRMKIPGMVYIATTKTRLESKTLLKVVFYLFGGYSKETSAGTSYISGGDHGFLLDCP